MPGPKATFALFAYSQQAYVRQAILGAFSQTYQPLEIILSDDCSADRTFAIMQEMAAAYRGPHIIRLNRNETNLGIGAHVNRVMELVTGEIIVGSAGDDISVADRTAVVVDTFNRSDGRAKSIYGLATLIDEENNEIGRFIEPAHPRCKTDLLYRVAKQAPGSHGASHAWHRSLFDTFGPLLPSVITEDRALTFRSFELGEVVAVDRELIKYRVHPDNIWFRVSPKYNREDHTRRCLIRAKAREVNFRQFLTDMEHPIFAEHHSAEVLSEARQIANKNVRLAMLEQEFISATRVKRLGVIARGITAGNTVQKTIKWMARNVLPESVYYDYVVRSNRRMTRDLARPGSVEEDA